VEIRIELPAVKLGVLAAEGVSVAPAGEELAREMEAVAARLRAQFTVEQVAELETVVAVRAMFRAWGMDPSKYRPSSEALLRRVVQGKGLYHISNVVDVINLSSIEAGWPYGLYDRACLHPPVAFRHGQAGETYEGIGKQTWHLAGRPVLADTKGPFGSPISDSTRSMITEATRELVSVIYAPVASAPAAVDRALALLGERLQNWTGARVTHTGTIAP